MKKLLAILLLLPTIAMGQDQSWFARAKTTAGGDIVLTTVRGPCAGNQLSMYLAARGGNVRWGCYFITDLHVMVRFEDGQHMAYDFEGWTINPNLKPKGNSF